MNYHTIDIEQGMQDAWLQGTTCYLPMFRGENLAIEKGHPETSTANLLLLVEAGLRPSRYRVNEGRSILVEFANGGSYLATGFSIGDESKQTLAFGKFLDRVHSDCDHASHLAALDFEATLAAQGDIYPIDLD
jgi:hypothetical protein